MNLKLLIFMVFLPFSLLAQQSVTLQECWSGAREQLPVLQNGTLFAKLDSIEQLVLKTSYYPQFNAKAQATWQSDVTSLDIPIPNVEVNQPSQEQYKIYLEINQLIWDGGRTKALIEKNRLSAQLSQFENDEAFYSIKARVANLYFALMLSQKQMNITQDLIATLESRLDELEDAVKQGVVREAGMYVLLAEKLQADQDLSNQKFQSQSIAKMLNVLTGLAIEPDWVLDKPLAVIPERVNRSQFKIFELQTQIAERGKVVLEKSRMPVINMFGQAGYGKPGLNMLMNEPDSYFMVGVGVSWKIFDWNNVKRKGEQLTVQQEIIMNGRAHFLYQIDTERKQYEVEIQQYMEALQKDEEIIDLREKITADYSSQLKQGAVTTSAFVEELFKEQAAKVTKQLHEIKLNQAQVALQILLEE